jgi:hypothetical protein
MAIPAVPAAPAFSKATSGDGTLLSLKVTGTAWQAVAELDDEDGLTDLPSRTQETYETTHMGSGSFKEFKKLFRGEGTETTITGNFVLGGDSVAVLEGARDSTDPVPYLITLKQGAETWYMVGFALFYDLAYTNPGADVRQFSITAKWVSAPVLTKEATV